MSAALSIDFETRSAVDINDAGADVYAESHTTEVICMAWAIGDGPVNIFRPLEGDPAPQEALDHIAAGKPVAAWNIAFESAIWRHVIPRQFPGWPQLQLEQEFDTMAQAYLAALPGALGMCAKAMGLPEEKDSAGGRLISKLSKPRKFLDDGAPIFWQPADAAADFAKFYAYCQQDVVVEREIGRRLKPLDAKERQIWLMDQRINRRGIRIDVTAARNAMLLARSEAKRLSSELAEATFGAVPTATNHGALLAWIKDQGVEAESVDKAAVADMLARKDLPAHVRKALLLRKEAGRTSTAKFSAMLEGVSADGRARGLFQYCGATTRRWAGRRIMLQNLTRPKMKAAQIGECIELFGQRDGGQIIDLAYGAPLDVLAWSVRGMLIPAQGHVFVGGDYSNIEGRGLSWLAGEDWKLQAFRDFDAGRGADLYKLAYGRSFGVDPAAIGDESDERQIGKVMELSLGYQGGVGAFRNMAKNYGARLDAIAATAIEAASPEAIEEAERKRQWLQVEHKMHADLPPATYLGIRILVDAWRAVHPETKALWKDLEECALSAVQTRGEKFTTRSSKITFACGKHFLYMKLPSGGVLSYARPSLEYVEDELRGGERIVVQFYAVKEDKSGGKKGKKRFGKVHGYGGHWAENATQGLCRDVLAEAGLRLEANGYPIVLHVHDEARCEVPEAIADVKRCEQLMGQIPTWAHGFPIAVKCDVMRRYHK